MLLQDAIGTERSLPNFGPYRKQKKEAIAKANENINDLLGENKVEMNRPAFQPAKGIPKVQEVIGRALDAIGTYNDLDNR